MHTSAIDVNKSLQSFHGNSKEQIRVEITTYYRELSRSLFEGYSVRGRIFLMVHLRGYQLTAKNSLTREKIEITIKGKKYLTYLHFQNKLKKNDSSKCNQASVVFTLTNTKDLITIFYVNWTPESSVLSLCFPTYFVNPCGSIITSKKERFYLLYGRNQ